VIRRRLWLLVPAVALYSADVAFTLAGQPAAYWAGDYSQPVEHNPLAHALLARHPALFAGAAVAWAVAFSAIVLLWRARASGWVAVLLALGHAIGGSTWLARHGLGGWALAVLYLALAAHFAHTCWRRAECGIETSRERQ
jgi:hypothetical protein